MGDPGSSSQCLASAWLSYSYCKLLRSDSGDGRSPSFSPFQIIVIIIVIAIIIIIINWAPHQHIRQPDLAQFSWEPNLSWWWAVIRETIFNIKAVTKCSGIPYRKSNVSYKGVWSVEGKGKTQLLVTIGRLYHLAHKKDFSWSVCHGHEQCQTQGLPSRAERKCS